MKQRPEFKSKALLGSQYFLYFGVMGIFLPYFNLYCYHIGFTGLQIGTLSGMRSLMLVLFPLMWGAIADRFHIRKPIYILCNFASVSIWGFFLLTEDFSMMLVITVVYSLFYGPIISFLEAVTMEVLDREKKSYGRIRVWGSVSFILMVAIIGKMIDVYPIRLILWLILYGALIQAILSVRIPKRHAAPVVRTRSNGLRTYTRKRVVVFLTAGFLMLVSHGTYYGFFSIHLEKLGFGGTFIGMSWALASIAEILVMINSDRLFKKWSVEHVLLVSFGVAAVRWSVLALASSATVILCSQVLHAVTYAAFHISCILYIDRLSPSETKTTGQAVNNAVSYGLGMMAGFLFNGFLFEHLPMAALFWISAGIALAGGGVFGGYQLSRRRLGHRMATHRKVSGSRD